MFFITYFNQMCLCSTVRASRFCRLCSSADDPTVRLSDHATTRSLLGRVAEICGPYELIIFASTWSVSQQQGLLAVLYQLPLRYIPIKLDINGDVFGDEVTLRLLSKWISMSLEEIGTQPFEELHVWKTPIDMLVPMLSGCIKLSATVAFPTTTFFHSSLDELNIESEVLDQSAILNILANSHSLDLVLLSISVSTNTHDVVVGAMRFASKRITFTDCGNLNVASIIEATRFATPELCLYKVNGSTVNNQVQGMKPWDYYQCSARSLMVLNTLHDFKISRGSTISMTILAFMNGYKKRLSVVKIMNTEAVKNVNELAESLSDSQNIDLIYQNHHHYPFWKMRRRIKTSRSPCWNCGNRGKTSGCARCNRARYCSKSCQRIHWNTVHRVVCDHPLDIMLDPEPIPNVFANNVWCINSVKSEHVEVTAIDDNHWCEAARTIPALNPTDISIYAKSPATGEHCIIQCLGDVPKLQSLTIVNFINISATHLQVWGQLRLKRIYLDHVAMTRHSLLLLLSVQKRILESVQLYATSNLSLYQPWSLESEILFVDVFHTMLADNPIQELGIDITDFAGFGDSGVILDCIASGPSSLTRLHLQNIRGVEAVNILIRALSDKPIMNLFRHLDFVRLRFNRWTSVHHKTLSVVLKKIAKFFPVLCVVVEAFGGMKYNCK